MQIKNFIKKISILIVGSILLTIAVISAVDSRTKNLVQNPTFEKKTEILLAKKNPKIIISGDSRSLNNLDPRVMEAMIKMPALNLSSGGQDLVTVVKLLQKYNLLSEQRIFILSISRGWIVDDTYSYSDVFIPNMTLKEKLLYCYQSESNCKFMLNYYGRTLVSSLFELAHYKRNDGLKPQDTLEDGFVALESKSQVVAKESPAAASEATPSRIDGARGQVFKRALEVLGNSNCRIFLYESPTNPTHKYKMEDTYKTFIESIISKYPNVHLINFSHSAAEVPLTQDDFIDDVHLNRKGAEKFSLIMLKNLNLN